MSAFSLLGFVSCAIDEKVTTDVFMTPEKYENQEIKVCGYYYAFQLFAKKTNLDAPTYKNGINVSEFSDELKANQKVCLHGEFSYLGCASDPDVICFDSGISDYELVKSKSKRP
ncbi:MAG: hypothetical protein HKN36_14230 [Hellea sp.]|nr:hypothetical protein [Hellea sp.]